DRTITLGMLLATVAQQMDRDGVMRDALERERDAYAPRGGAAEVRMERDAHSGWYGRTSWSIAPKIDAPLSSSISILTRSPNFMNGVFASPSRMISSTRFSARHDAPFDSSWFAIV